MPSLPVFGSIPAAPTLSPAPAQATPPAGDAFADFDSALDKGIKAALAGGLDAIQKLATPPAPAPTPVSPAPSAYSLPGVAAPPVPAHNP